MYLVRIVLRLLLCSGVSFVLLSCFAPSPPRGSYLLFLWFLLFLFAVFFLCVCFAGGCAVCCTGGVLFVALGLVVVFVVFAVVLFFWVCYLLHYR